MLLFYELAPDNTSTSFKATSTKCMGSVPWAHTRCTARPLFRTLRLRYC